MAADFLGVSSSGSLDYRLSSGPRVELDNTVARRSTVVEARNERIRVLLTLLHHLGGQQAFFGLCYPTWHRRSMLGSMGPSVVHAWRPCMAWCASAVTTTAATFGEPCVPRDSSADDLICAAVLAAGGLDYRLSSDPRVELDKVARRSTIFAARSERDEVTLASNHTTVRTFKWAYDVPPNPDFMERWNTVQKRHAFASLPPRIKLLV